jgi:hypothetical protein
MEVILFELHHVWLCVLPREHTKVGLFFLDLWHDYICIEKDHELWDGGSLVWCVVLKIKC